MIAAIRPEDEDEPEGDEGEADAPDDRSAEYAACLADAAYFIDQHLTIDDSQGHGDGSGTMPFELWPAQVAVVWALMAERLSIVLKARQLGISWICCGYALWRCLFLPGQVVLLFSQGQDEANELLRRVKVLYERMPEWLKDACPLAKPPNTSEMNWENGSRVKSLPATRHAGSGWTASLVLVDEAAKILFADDLFAALKPTIDGGGQLVVVSTAFGIGNKFHALWTKAAAGLNGFRPIFLPWRARPGRDQAWYDAQVAEETDPRRVKENYPATAIEAFMVSGRPRFDSRWIQAQAMHVHPGLPEKSLPDELRAIPGLAVYEPPAEGRRYQIGADVAKGLEDGDYSDATVIDAETWVEVASLRGHWEPDEFADHLMTLADFFNAAPIGVERNNHGGTVLATIRLRNIERSKDGRKGCAISKGHDDQLGWDTNVRTKPQIIDLLATALRDEQVAIRTQAALDELLIYRIEPDGKTSAPSGYHDDMVMSRAIALALVRRPSASNVLGKAVAVPLGPRRLHAGHRPDEHADWDRKLAEAIAVGMPDQPGVAPPAQMPASMAEFEVEPRKGRRNFYGR